MIEIKYVIGAIVFSGIGMVMFGLGLYLFDKLTPFQFWKEILEDQNTALAIIVGSAAIGMGIIIAAAVG